MCLACAGPALCLATCAPIKARWYRERQHGSYDVITLLTHDRQPALLKGLPCRQVAAERWQRGRAAGVPLSVCGLPAVLCSAFDACRAEEASEVVQRGRVVVWVAG